MAREKVPDTSMDELYRAFLLLETVEECRAFLLDLCTRSEMNSMAQRLLVARLLQENLTYTEITELTGVSAATISRVSRALDYGEDGYRLILDRLGQASGGEVDLLDDSRD